MGKPGEKLLALNGEEYVIDETMCVIADDTRAEALGGIIGGELSGCTDETTGVFLECAFFDPIRTAMTGRKLQIISDARFRFERGVDPAFLTDGAEIATRLILDLCGGEPSELVVAGREPDWERTLVLRPERIKALGGVDVPLDEIERILLVLGFRVSGENGQLEVSIPSWRSDIVGEACLVEEVVRIFGYDKIQAVPVHPDSALPQPALLTNQRRHSQARRVLAGRGMVEAVTYSFLSAERAALFGGAIESIILANPISTDLGVMRPSLLPNLLDAAKRNADYGIEDIALYEVGPQFSGDRPEDEVFVAAGIRVERKGARNWAEATRVVDAFDAKADAIAVLADLGAPTGNLQVFRDAPDWYHPGRSGSLKLGPKNTYAFFGELHPGIVQKIGLKGPVAGFEIFVDMLPEPKAKKSATRPVLDLSPYQRVKRDFAFIVDVDVDAGNIIRAAKGADKKLISDVSVFDVFAGGKLGDDKKSVAISVTLQPMNSTLTDAEIEAVAGKVISNVKKQTGGILRG
jgi:phenylalanyl-tRNA synthetase beta chain